MTYPPLLAVFACLVALLALHPLAYAIGLIDKPRGRKLHKGEVPLIGGLGLFAAIALTHIIYGTPPFPIIIALGITVAVGTLDDLFDVSARTKLLCQIGVALVMCLVGNIYVTSLGTVFEGRELLLGHFSMPFTVLAFVGLVNAMNMIDGIDGLAGGLTAVALANMLIGLTLLTGSATDALTIDLQVLLAALAVFLVFNFELIRNRKVFLGDAGSMLLGLYLGYFLITNSQPELAPEFMTAPLPASLVPWLVALPILDTLRLIWRRARQGKSPFVAGRNHIHHILLNRGFSPNTTFGIILVVAVTLFWVGFYLWTINSFLAGIFFPVLVVAYTFFTERFFAAYMQ